MLESEDFCRQIGLEVTVRYSDEVGSREEFKRMMADASGGQAPFDHVVVWKPVCFALQLEEAILEKEKLTAHGIKLLAVKHKTLDD